MIVKPPLEDASLGITRAFAGRRSVLAEQLDPALDEAARRVAVDAFHALRLRDQARK